METTTGGDNSEDVPDSVVVEVVDNIESVNTVVSDKSEEEEGVTPPESVQKDGEQNTDQSTEECDKTNVSKSEKSKNKESNRGRSPRKKKEVEKVEHKKPNINVASRLADYIKAPLPVKVKEEPKPKSNEKKNLSKVIEENDKVKQSDIENEKNIKKKVEKEPPKIIKRTTPKSKWGNIMSQIEENQTKPKPKKEVKSSLQEYLSTPVPVIPKKEEKKAEIKPKKTIPKPDYSKVKSKLNLAPPSAPVSRRNLSPRPGDKPGSRRHSSITSCSSALQALPKLGLNDSCSSSVLGSGISSVRSSHSDLNAAVEGEQTTETDGETTTPRAAQPGSKYWTKR